MLLAGEMAVAGVWTKAGDMAFLWYFLLHFNAIHNPLCVSKIRRCRKE